MPPYGQFSAPFRQALSERGLTRAVGVGARQKVYPGDVAGAVRLLNGECIYAETIARSCG